MVRPNRGGNGLNRTKVVSETVARNWLGVGTRAFGNIHFVGNVIV
jgi:hypothetical protein